MKLRSDPKEIARTIAVLFRAGDVTEVRIPKTERMGTVSGYFDKSDLLAEALASPNGDFPSVYVTLNPVTPALLARAANRTNTTRRPPRRTRTSSAAAGC